MANTSRLTSITAYENQSKYYSTIANNLTNAQTPGFKRDIPLFRSLLEQKMGPSPYPLIFLSPHKFWGLDDGKVLCSRTTH